MIVLPKIEDPRGNLSFIEHGERGACPFELGKVAWIYDVPTGRERSLACDTAPQMLVAMSGSFDAAGVHLNRSDRGLAIGTGSVVTLDNFSTNSVAMILGGDGGYGSHAALACDGRGEAHSVSTVEACRFIELPRRRDDDGSVTEVVNGAEGVPFDVRRVFYLYDVPADAERGGHSHHLAQEMIVALSGSFDVVLDDGFHTPRRFSLSRPYRALYVPTGLWRTLDNFSGGAVCLVLTSERYSEEDYVRDYGRFKQLTSKKVYEKI